MEVSRVFSPHEPPDGGGAPSTNVPGQKLSFKEKLVGEKMLSGSHRKVDLIKENLASFDYAGGDKLFPIFHLDESVKERISAPWKEALVVKLLGKEIGFLAMRDRLKKLWKPLAGFDILDIGFGYYLVKFDAEEDQAKVMDGGPLMLFDHYLSVQTWSREFISSSAKIDKTLVWVGFPCLNVAYYDEEVLMALASGIGSSIKIDFNTLKVSRGKFVRVCVEIDLNKLVVGRVCVEKKWLCVEYEGLHIICAKCGCYGHHARDCHNHQETQFSPMNSPADSAEIVPNSLPPTVVPVARGLQAMENPSSSSGKAEDIPPNPHGSWLTVTKKFKKRSQPNQNDKGKDAERDSGGNKTGNRFENLEIEDCNDGNGNNGAVDHVVHEPMQSASLRDRVTGGNKPHVGLKIKRKIISPISKLAQVIERPNHNSLQSAPIKAQKSDLLNKKK